MSLYVVFFEFWYRLITYQENWLIFDIHKKVVICPPLLKYSVSVSIAWFSFPIWHILCHCRVQKIQSNLGYRTILFSNKSVSDQKIRDFYVSDVEHKFVSRPNLAYYWLTDSWSTSTIVWKGCGRNNMGNVMRNNVHCDAIKLTWKKANNKCKFLGM